MTNEEFIYLTIPKEFKNTYKKLLYALADFGKDIVINCHNQLNTNTTNLISCWNLFQSAIAAKEIGNDKAAELYIKYIDKQLDIIYRNFNICNLLIPTPPLPEDPDIPDEPVNPTINNKMFIGFNASSIFNFDITTADNITKFDKNTNNPKGVYEVINDEFGAYLWIAIPTTMNVTSFTTGGGTFTIPMGIEKKQTTLVIDGKSIAYNYWRSSIQCKDGTFPIEINYK